MKRLWYFIKLKRTGFLKHSFAFSALACMFISMQAHAVDPFEDFHEYGQLSDEEIHQIHKGELLYGDVEFGLIVSKGNTDSTSLKFRSNLYQDLESWRNQVKIDTLYKRDKNDVTGEDEVSADRFFISGQANYKIGVKNASFFIYGDHEQDKFSGLKQKSTLATGYGNRLYQGAKNTVDVDVGPGFVHSVVDDEIEVAEGEDRSTTGYLVRIAMQWERVVSERTRFNQDISYEQSLSGLNSRLKSETALISKVMDAVSLKFSYMYRYNSKPEEDKLKYDTELSAVFVYSF